jgi:hypothetical protein
MLHKKSPGMGVNRMSGRSVRCATIAVKKTAATVRPPPILFPSTRFDQNLIVPVTNN